MTSRVLLVGALLGLLACGAEDAASDSRVRIEVDAGARTWVATGAPVDEGVICPSGSARLSGFHDGDGGDVAIGEFFTRMDAAIVADPPDQQFDLVLLIEYLCPDGSGAFTLAEEWRNGGPWSVVGGLGAYERVSGSGVVTIERDPPDAPDDPPAGHRSAIVLDGDLALPPVTDA